MNFFPNLLAMIGNTPIIKVQRLDTGPCELYLKLESQNPGGSIKDRIALYMVEQAEQRGQLQPGATLVEATAGNTGLSLALVARLKGYQCMIVMPDKMSKEKICHLRALGAQVIMTRSDVSKGHPEYYQEVAERLAQDIPGAYYINQFNNPDNVTAHFNSTGPEIWQQMEGKLDAFVAGMGTSGTLTGGGKFLRSVNPNIELILADPAGSILADYINHGNMGQATSWLVEGIGEDYLPAIGDTSLINHAIRVTDKDAFLSARQLLLAEGILAGSSTGTLLSAALHYCRQQTQAKRVLTLVCDTGNKYFSKLYDDIWMRNQGFFAAPSYSDLRDFIAYSMQERRTITVARHEPLIAAHKRLTEHQLSQLPVVDGTQLLGIITETELLHALRTDTQALTHPVSEFMQPHVITLASDASSAELNGLLEQHSYVAILHNGQFCGLVTRIDVANYLIRNAHD